MSQRFSLGVVIRAVGAGAFALGAKGFAMAKGVGGASGAVKGLTGLALGGGAAAALASSKTNDSNSEDLKAVAEQKLPNIALSQQQEQRSPLPRR